MRWLSPFLLSLLSLGAMSGVAISPVGAAGLPVAVDSQPLPSLAPMLEKVSPAVVNIATSATIESPVLRDPFFGRLYKRPPRKISSLGSGVIVDAQKGLVLTNHHVIANADEITVTLFDGRELKASLIGSDDDTDVAVLKVEPKNLTAVPLADSDKLRVGDFVVAIGNPFSLGHSVTSGIVSALGRQGLGIEQYENFIQTDAAINPGNSGGALVNLRGELVGINTAIVSPGGSGNIGIGFAIPINLAVGIEQQLVQHGEVRRGALGFSGNDMSKELAEALGITQTTGVIVTEVSERTPADRAGIKTYDIITALNGKPVRNRADLFNQLGLLPADSTVSLDVLRDNRKLTVQAKLSSQLSARTDGSKIHPLLEGVVLRNRQQRGEPAGVEIVELQKRARLASFGISAGDVIVGIGRYAVDNLDDLKKLADGQRVLPLNIVRDDASYMVIVK
ncbi:Do family serine endopeptidase [Permianibacter sp. IMCC34836]|uniref:Do family serine endopeptidase n=1 Tax=Permianibacter fluminis TaxID=2738515 RepID=UPI0015580FF7|nr:Do family serine endopeptidase [Permianibacter fluminis]NQD39037.1 Do family serine endopeptidase [Permianibacter fluminis]